MKREYRRNLRIRQTQRERGTASRKEPPPWSAQTSVWARRSAREISASSTSVRWVLYVPLLRIGATRSQMPHRTLACFDPGIGNDIGFPSLVRMCLAKDRTIAPINLLPTTLCVLACSDFRLVCSRSSLLMHIRRQRPANKRRCGHQAGAHQDALAPAPSGVQILQGHRESR